jgi:carbamoyltransferase
MTELILAVHPGIHDAAAAVLADYEVKAAVQLERMTRKKGDGGLGFPSPCVEEALSIAGITRRDIDVLVLSRSDFPVRYFKHFRGWRWAREQFRTHVEGRAYRWMPRETMRAGTPRVEDFFDVPSYRRDLGFGDRTKVFFHNHHLAHALPALFYTDWEDALLVTADGGGDQVNYSHRYFARGAINEIYGGDEYLTKPHRPDSLGQAYWGATQAIGFRPNRHEGKLTGLAALGNPLFADEIGAHFWVESDGQIMSDFRNVKAMLDLMHKIARGSRREDVAASIQKVLEDKMLASVRRLLELHPARRLGVAGGVFANVRLNRVLAEQLPIDEIFIVPPMGDEGLPVGGALAYLLERDGIAHWLKHRHRLSNVYLGRDYTKAADCALSSAAGITRTPDAPIAGAAQRVANGAIGAIYTGRMEYGPRALGARSILASPARRETHDLLNERLDRSEFMPFAPVIAADKAAGVFDVSKLNAYACRFMTITCDVRPEWRKRIPAVVHVDNSARPQIIERDVNPLYFDIVAEFHRATGIPVLVNTSFNVHEEPIVNAPDQCIKALADGRIDFVVTQQALYERTGVEP